MNKLLKWTIIGYLVGTVIGILLSVMYDANAYDEVFIKYNVNVANGSVADAKALGFGYVTDLSVFKVKYEAGHIFDHRRGAKDSYFGFVGLGIQPEFGPVFINFFQNIGGITTIDKYLGGHFQFNEELGLGVKDQRTKVAMSLFYSHISNAGIRQPNMGKDFGGLKITLPW